MSKHEINVGIPVSTWPLVKCYALRILVRLGMHRMVMDEKRVLDPDLFAELGIRCPSPEVPHRPDLLFLRLRNRMKAYEGRTPQLPSDLPLAINLRWLASALELNPVEAAIVQFMALLHHAPLIQDLLEHCRALRIHEVHAMFAMILGCPVGEVAEALSPTSKLVQSGLIWVNLTEKWRVDQKIGFLEGIADQLMVSHSDPFQMFLSNVRRSEPGSLRIDDFAHLNADLCLLVPYLRDSLRTRRVGVNLLFVGPPGTGKTELARTLAEELGSPLYEIAIQDRRGYPYDGRARLGAFQLSQGLLGGEPPPLVLFDEVEEVLRPSEEGRGAGSRRKGIPRKAWINQQLQENRTPCIWICNDTWGFENSYLRRFDFIVRVDIPPRSVRLRMLERYTADLSLSPSWLQEVAQHEHLSPAAMERATKVTRVIQATTPVVKPEEALERIIGNALEGLGVSRHPRDRAPSEMSYRLDVLNADRDLAQVIEGIRLSGSARIALWGPPGTGKSAFAHYLAEQLDRPLLVKRASDLQSSWVGETEKALASMFEDASRENAVLLLDEADSFLSDRRGAQRSWEVSQVNELLTQMEVFRGIFVASTNRVEHLDEAAFRRFDAKIHFGYLTAHQRVVLFCDCLNTLGLRACSEPEERVSRIPRLTPGDFNVIMRQNRLDPISSAADFAARLVKETRMKPGGGKAPIGFQGGLYEAV